MNNEQAFAAATLPPRRVILRVPLLPYSVGHEILLLRQGNPLLLPLTEFRKVPMDKQLAAAMNAIVVCSRTWEQNQHPDRWVKLWAWVIRKDNFPAAIAQFRMYRNEGSTWPRSANEGGNDKDSRVLGSPSLARTLKAVRGDFDYPLGAAQWIYCAAAECEGQCKIENEDERNIREQIETLESEILREQKQAKPPQKEPPCQP